MKKPGKFWRALETIPGLTGTLADWKLHLRTEFDLAKSFLRPRSNLAASVPCPADKSCGCAHGVVVHGSDDIAAVCRCTPKACQTSKLSRSDIVLYQLNRATLGTSIAKALGAKPETDVTDRYHMTWQIGSYEFQTGFTIPLILTIQSDSEDFGVVVSNLAANAQKPFVLFGPTDDYLRPEHAELLRRYRARFIPMSEILEWDGKFSTVRPLREAMGDLIEEISPPPNELFVFQKKGGMWRTVFRGDEKFIRDSKGMDYLHLMLASPNKEFHCTMLYGGDASVIAPLNIEAVQPDIDGLYAEESNAAKRKGKRVGVNTIGDVDNLKAIKRRLDEIKEKIEEAEELGKNEEAGRLKEEQNTLTKEIGRLMYGGKARQEGLVKRPRQAVGSAINRALDTIKENHQALWKHLDSTVERGEFLIYRPDDNIHWILNL